jgi:osmotically-inducible protein OsmY
LIRDQAEHADLTRMELVSRIEQRLLADQELAVYRLRVHLDAERIVLEGEALTQADRQRAESTARSLAPEAQFDNRVVLRPPTSA